MSVESVAYRGQEFSANNTYLEIWLWQIVDVLNRRPHLPTWLEEVRSAWHLQATSGFGFGVCPELDRFLNTSEKAVLMQSVFDETLLVLNNRSDDFLPKELSASHVGGNDSAYAEPVARIEVIAVGKSFRKLLSDSN
jgi:hypothetical protein